MSLLAEVIVDSEPAMPCQIEEKNEKFSFFVSPAEVALAMLVPIYSTLQPYLQSSQETKSL